MEKTDIIFGFEAKEKMLSGINTLADAVETTIGPAGRNVLINEIMQEPHITKDGVTVAKSVKFSDAFMEAGAKIIRQAAKKTCDDTGDGTTSVTVLARKMINDGMNFIKENKYARLNKMRDGMIKASEIAESYINSISSPCESEKMIKRVATISGNNDETIGDIVCEAMLRATKDGAVSIEDSPSSETYVETINGMRFDKGFKSPLFATSEDGQRCEYTSCNIILWKGVIDNMNDFTLVIQPALEKKRPILIIADGYSYDIINAIAVNKMNNGFSIVAAEAPSFRENREAMMKDIEVLTNGMIINTMGITPENFKAEYMGSCERVTVTKDYTIIVGGDGSEELINERVEEIKSQLEVENNTVERINLRERLAKLAGGISIIYAGGNSEAEVKELKDRLDDAVCAVRSAMKTGVVAGGGSTYIRLKKHLDKEIEKYSGENEYYIEGMKLVSNSLYECFKSIMKNIYFNENEVDELIESISNNKNTNCGFDANNLKFIDDMVDSGIVDPTKTSVMVIKNSVSVAAIFLTTDCAIAKYITE